MGMARPGGRDKRLNTEIKEAKVNGLHQCWSCSNCIGAKRMQPIKQHHRLPDALYPECKIMKMYMCEVYAICEKRTKRSCENCGNLQCANSIVAFYWDECVESHFEKHWQPKEREGGKE